MIIWDAHYVDYSCLLYEGYASQSWEMKKEMKDRKMEAQMKTEFVGS